MPLHMGCVVAVVESGVLGVERQRDIARGAVAVLGDDEFGGSRFAVAVDLGLYLVLGAIDERNDADVLLDGAQFAKVEKREAFAMACRSPSCRFPCRIWRKLTRGGTWRDSVERWPMPTTQLELAGMAWRQAHVKELE